MSDSPEMPDSSYESFDDQDWSPRRRVPPLVYALGATAGVVLIAIIGLVVASQEKQPAQKEPEVAVVPWRPQPVIGPPVRPDPVVPSPPEPPPQKPVEEPQKPPEAPEPPPDPPVKADPLRPPPRHTESEAQDRRVAEDFVHEKFPLAEFTEEPPPVAATDVETGREGQLYKLAFTQVVVADIGNRVGKQRQNAIAYVLVVEHRALHWKVGNGADSPQWRIENPSSVAQSPGARSPGPVAPTEKDSGKNVNLSDIANFLAKWQRIRDRDLGHSGNPLTEQEKFEQLDRQVREEWERDFEGHIFRSDAMTVTAINLDPDGSIWITARQVPRYIRLHVTDVDDDAVHKVRVRDRIGVSGILTCPARTSDTRTPHARGQSFWGRVSGNSPERTVEGIYVESVKIGLRR